MIYCQQPHWFADLPVATEPVTEADLEQWAGAISYHHRSKPCLMRRALHKAGKLRCTPVPQQIRSRRTRELVEQGYRQLAEKTRRQ